MKKMKWIYACSMAMALVVLPVTAVSCGDVDSPTQEQGEVVENPVAAVEYYITGKVTSAGTAVANLAVKVGSNTYTTDANGVYTATVDAKGTYNVSVSNDSYIAQNANVVIAADALNRSTVTLGIALTKKSPAVTVKPAEATTVTDKSETNESQSSEDDTAPVVKAELEIPAGAVTSDQEISVTNYVPTEDATATTSTGSETVNATLAAINCQPSGLQFANPVTIAMPVPANSTSSASDLTLYYLDTTTNKWVAQDQKVRLEDGKYKVDITHFSSYKIEDASITSTSSKFTEVAIAQKVYDNSTSAVATTDVLNYNKKLGWAYDGTALTGADHKAIVKDNGGASAGVTSTSTLFKNVAVSGFTRYTISAVTTVTKKVYTKNGKVIATVNVYNGSIVPTEKTESFTHSGGNGGTN